MSKTKKKAKLGRPFAPAGKVATERSICWLVPADKELLQAYSKEHGISESTLLRDGLEASGVLPPDPRDEK